MVFTEVEVHRAWKMVMRATEECSSNLGSIFLIVFIFSVALSRRETIHMCIYFVVFPVHLIHLSWHHETSFFLTQRLGIVGNSTSCPSLNSLYGNRYGEPESGKNSDFLHRVCLFESFYLVGWFHGSLQCTQASIFLSRWDDRGFSKQTRWCS